MWLVTNGSTWWMSAYALHAIDQMVLSGSPSTPIHRDAGEVQTLAKRANARPVYATSAPPAEVTIRSGLSSCRVGFAHGQRAGESLDRLPEIRADQQVRANPENGRAGDVREDRDRQRGETGQV